jgi:hypothetical protein
MGHMQAQIQGPTEWWEVETTQGTTWVECENVGRSEVKAVDLLPFLEVTDTDCIVHWEFKSGYGARLHAPGYLDCTEWSVFDTEDEAREHLFETWNYCPMCLEEIDQAAKCSCLQKLDGTQWNEAVDAYVMENCTLGEVISLPGIYEIVSEEYNNIVIDTVHSKLIQDWLDRKKTQPEGTKQ